MRRLTDVLSSPELGGFDVLTICDETAHNVHTAIESLCVQASPDDVLLVYYTGHALLTAEGELHFTARDTDVDLLRSTAPSARFVVECLRASRSRAKILILDCSYSASCLRGVPTPDHMMILTSSDAFEDAMESTEAGGGIFTTALIEGIRTGDADLDGDGDTTIEELYSYVRRVVHEHRQRPRLLNLADRTIVAARSPKHVFISYCRDDDDMVQRVDQILHDLGHKTWLDTSTLSGGAEWRDRLTSALDRAKAVVAVLSPAAFESPWVRRELEYAEEINVPVIPIDVMPANAPAWFRLTFGRLQRLDFTSPTGAASWPDVLADAIRVSVATASISR